MNTKLTRAQIVAIREDAAAGITDGIIARHYKIARRTIYDIRTGKSWPNAGGPITGKGTGRKRRAA